VGLSRRIKFRIKFSRKYIQDVYGFFAKKQITKDTFINKVSASLLKTEKISLQKKFFFLLQETIQQDNRRVRFIGQCLFIVKKLTLYISKFLQLLVIQLKKN